MSHSGASRRGAIGLVSTAALAASSPAAELSQAPQPCAQDADLGARVYNVRNFGAKGDGWSLDTAAFQSALDSCTKERGGTVLVPAGEFVIGSIELKSNVTLHLAAAAQVLGSTDIADYRSRGTGRRPTFTLIYAADAENVSIEGKGVIDGQGKEYQKGARDDGDAIQGRPRPHLMEFVKCRRLSFRDISLLNSAYWSTRITECSFVQVDGVRIYTRVNFNNDGVHRHELHFQHTLVGLPLWGRCYGEPAFLGYCDEQCDRSDLHRPGFDTERAWMGSTLKTSCSATFTSPSRAAVPPSRGPCGRSPKSPGRSPSLFR
jgi:polygalacturonase